MLIESRPVKLTTRTGVEVRRTLPHRDLKMIGAWCFVDHFGPTQQTDGMVVAAHPHTGLQTVTWLLEGAIEHRDSIGSIQRIEPGQLNLMTAGHGISHSELSLAGPERLHAVQLWVALPEHSMAAAPEFEHQPNLPTVKLHDFSGHEIGVATVLAGSFLGKAAPTKIFSPMVGAEIRLKPNQALQLKLEEGFEHGILAVEGEVQVARTPLETSSLKYLEVGTESVQLLSGDAPVTLLLLGGKPFGERILMWWNFIGRTHADIAEARELWNRHLETPDGIARFGVFEDEIGGWIPAPELPSVQLRAR